MHTEQVIYKQDEKVQSQKKNNVLLCTERLPLAFIFILMRKIVTLIYFFRYLKYNFILILNAKECERQQQTRLHLSILSCDYRVLYLKLKEETTVFQTT